MITDDYYNCRQKIEEWLKMTITPNNGINENNLSIDSNIILLTGNKSILPDIENFDVNLRIDVLWDLYREGIVRFGLAGSPIPVVRNDNFGITTFGKSLLLGNDPIPSNIKEYMENFDFYNPGIDLIVRNYAQEGASTFKSQNYIASVVMLGCASEQMMRLLADAIDNKGVTVSARTMNTTINKIEAYLASNRSNIDNLGDRDIMYQWDKWFKGIAGFIRDIRNAAGHPNLPNPTSYDVLTILHLLPKYIKKINSVISIIPSI